MEMKTIKMTDILNRSVQINDGLTQTSADGASLAFDRKYGIMFCAYMPGLQGHYGESRGKIALSYFPASQPTNIRFVDVAVGNDVYCPACVGLGDGKVRVLYEKDSRAEGDHRICYKDFDFLTGKLSEEKIVMLYREDGSLVPLCQSEVFAYLDSKGLHAHRYCRTEQWATTGIFNDDQGTSYGCYTSLLAEPVLYRSRDFMATVEFFAAYSVPVQYEFVYRFLNGTIYAIYRTPPERNSIFYTTSADMGKNWSEPVLLEDSVSCRPAMLCYNGHILMAYNFYNPDTGNRPAIQQARTTLRFRYGECENPNRNVLVAELYRKGGMVNMGITEVLGDVYLAFSTSELALEYQNGNPMVRGKDSIRYVKLGNLIPEM